MRITYTPSSVWKPTAALVLGWLAVFAAVAQDDVRMRTERLKPVPFTCVHLTDSFWRPRMEVNRTVSIPSAFHECEVNGRFDNFALAGGLIQGEHRGDFSFDDTDPYKIIEGASYALAVQYDARLDAYLDSVITLIAAAQEPDGYLCTCVTNRCERLSGWWGRSRWEKINSHELYNCGHLYEAAVAHYRATGKRTLLDVALRNADLVCRTFGPDSGQIHRPGGHPIVEMALCKLYEVTGKAAYLAAARYFVEETGRGTDGHPLSAYSQDHKPIVEQDEIVGHAVRAGYLYSGVADVASLTGDTTYFNALCRLWHSMADTKLYITGGIGSRAQGEGFGPAYELHNHTAYCETCAAISNVFWNHRLFLSTGDVRFVDLLERALYNGVIAGVSLSGDRFFYDNPLESMGQHERQRWFGCACCPGNITRFVASVPGYVYATDGRDVYVNLYVAGTADVQTDRLSLRLTQVSGMPWTGGTTLTVSVPKTQRFRMRLRIPAWLTDRVQPGSTLYEYRTKGAPFTVWVNGKQRSYAVEQGYAVLDGRWKDGDEIRVDFGLPVRRITAHPLVRDDRGKVALQRGPLVYCLEGTDQTDGKVLNKYLRPNVQPEAVLDADRLGGVVVLRMPLQRVPDAALTAGGEQTVEGMAIPYYIWCNRGPGEMEVWIPESAECARPVPVPSLAERGRAVMWRAPLQKDAPASAAAEEEVGGVNDRWEPVASSDTSKPYHYWWLKKGSKETLAYTFAQPETVHSASVYWLDWDHYDGNYRVPVAWKLYYLAGDSWLEVEDASDYGVQKDTYNRVTFRPVTTTALRMEVQLQPGQSGGVLEWKLNE